MSRTQQAVVLLAVQAALVLSIAAKYLYEREVCSRIWVRAAQYDPSAQLRGRYLALHLALDACALPRDVAYHTDAIAGSNPHDAGSWRWTVKLVVQGGKLVPLLASDTDRPELTNEITLSGDRPCDQATLLDGIEYFVSDAAKTPFPLKKGEELWVEVTVPPMGPPRPIQLAVSDNGTFIPLSLQ